MLRSSIRLALRLGIVAALASGVAGAQSLSDDIGPDGLKLRGDGSVDDDQPDGVDLPDGDGFVRVNKVDNRFVDADGNQVRDRLDVHVNSVTGVTRERERTRTRAPDGTKTEVRIERFIDVDGNVISETVREKGGENRADRSDRAERSEREERADRTERAERPERADRPERAERPERADRPERAERPERPDRADRSG